MFILGLRSWWRQKRAARMKKTLVFAVDLQDNNATSRELLCSCARATRSYFHICVDACVLGKRNKVGAQSPYDDMRLSRRHWILVGHPKLTPPARAKMRCNVHVVASASFVARAHKVGHSLSPFLFLAFSFSLSLSLSLSLLLSPTSFFKNYGHRPPNCIGHRPPNCIGHQPTSPISLRHSPMLEFWGRHASVKGIAAAQNLTLGLSRVQALGKPSQGRFVSLRATGHIIKKPY